MGRIYDGTAATDSDSVSTSSGSLTTPNYLSDVYLSVSTQGIRVMTTTSGGGGILVENNSARVMIGTFAANSTIRQLRRAFGSWSSRRTSRSG